MNNNVIELVINCEDNFLKNDKLYFLNRLFCSAHLPNGDRSLPLFNKFLKASFGSEYLDIDIVKHLEIKLDSNDFLIFQLDKKLFFEDISLSSKKFLRRLLNFLRKTNPYLNYYIRSNLSNLSFYESERRFIKNNVVIYTKDCNYVDLEFSISSNLDVTFLIELKDIILYNLSLDNNCIRDEELISISTHYCETCVGYNEKFPIHFMVTSLRKNDISNSNGLDSCLLFDNNICLSTI